MFYFELRHFVDCVRGRATPAVTPAGRRHGGPDRPRRGARGGHGDLRPFRERRPSDDRRHTDRADGGAAPAAHPEPVRERRHDRVRPGGAHRRRAAQLSRRERARPAGVRAGLGAGPREPGRPHRGQRSDRAHALPHGPHRRRAGEPQDLDAGPVRRRAGERRGVGARRDRHAEHHRVAGRGAPRAGAPRLAPARHPRVPGLRRRGGGRRPRRRLRVRPALGRRSGRTTS